MLSNKREYLSQRLLEELSLSEYFDRILGSDSVVEKKPSPKPLFQVIDSISCKPAETVIVGDSTYDIDAGKAAGVDEDVVFLLGHRRPLLFTRPLRLKSVPTPPTSHHPKKTPPATPGKSRLQ